MSPKCPMNSDTSTDGVDSIEEQMFAKLDPRNYAIACLDVLGQNRAFSAAPQLMTSPADLRAYLPVLQRTFMAVRTLRMFMTRCAQQMGDTGSQQSNYASDQYFRFNLGAFSFADTLVMYVELNPSRAAQTAVCSLLQACSLAMLVSLGIRNPLRGGVDVGWASRVEKEGAELYGPGLNRAHCLESRIADYPRIVVGRGVQHLMETGLETEFNRAARDVQALLAGVCQELLYTDDDGELALDYLGRYSARHFGHVAVESGLTGRDVVSQGYAFLLEQGRIYHDASDIKLAGRYAKAVAYYRSRLPFWELNSDPDAHKHE